MGRPQPSSVFLICFHRVSLNQCDLKGQLVSFFVCCSAHIKTNTCNLKLCVDFMSDSRHDHYSDSALYYSVQASCVHVLVIGVVQIRFCLFIKGWDPFVSFVPLPAVRVTNYF